MDDGGPSVTARRVAAHRLGFTRVAMDYGDPAADEALAADVVDGLVVPPSRMHDYLAARTSFFDRGVTGAIDCGVRQVVTGAAGYDGRSLRYAKPGVRWFEVDHPATQRDKLARLKRLGIAAAGVRFVEADFTRDPVAARLREAGLDADAPSLFLLEGVAVYLEPAVLENVLDQFRQVAAPGSQLAISVSTSRPAEGTRARFQAAVAAMGEPGQVLLRGRPGPGPARPDRLADNGRRRESGHPGRAHPLGRPAHRDRRPPVRRWYRLRRRACLRLRLRRRFRCACRAPATFCAVPPGRVPAVPFSPAAPGRAPAAVGPAVPGARRVHHRVRQPGRAQSPAPHHQPRPVPDGRRSLAGVTRHVRELHAVRHRGAPHRRRARSPRPYRDQPGWHAALGLRHHRRDRQEDPPGQPGPGRRPARHRGRPAGACGLGADVRPH